MSDLPYIQIEKELFLNLGIVVLIINELASTKRGKKILTIEKLQIFFFLVTRPVFLNKVLENNGKPTIIMREEEYYTVNTLSVNLDELFDREKIKSIIKLLSYKKWLDFEYDKKYGFLINLNNIGKKSAEEFTGGHFDKIKRYSHQLSFLQSESPSKINEYINQVFKKEF